MLLTRLLTALALIPLVVAAVLWLPPAGLAVLLALVAAGSAWEWSQFALHPRRGRLSYALGVGLLAVLLPLQPWLTAVLGCVFWLSMLIWLGVFPRGIRQGITQPALRLLIGAALLVLFAAGALAMALEPAGRELILITLVLVWAMDVGGYFAGKRFGRRRLAPLISPNKSWEGFWGGAVLAAIVAVVAAYGVLGLSGASAMGFVGLAMVVAMLSVIGDLTESMFKRQTGIKDSGTLLPGHGGLLDRLDSTYAAMPLMLAGSLLLEAV
nr:phosphatidate cytidylyltransferase [Oceanococcus sp. HetDA_MAG_MS8]